LQSVGGFISDVTEQLSCPAPSFDASLEPFVLPCPSPFSVSPRVRSNPAEENRTPYGLVDVHSPQSSAQLRAVESDAAIAYHCNKVLAI
jgi:hypothetical protein